MPVEEKKRLKGGIDKKRRTEKAEELKTQKKAAYALWGPLHRDKQREDSQRTCLSTSSIAANQNMRNGKEIRQEVTSFGVRRVCECLTLFEQLVKQ